MSVLGVLILTTLMMCLDLTHVVARAQTSQMPAPTDDTEDARVVELQHQVEAARRRYETVLKQVQALTQAARIRPQHIQIERAQLEQNLKRVQELETKVQEHRRSMAGPTGKLANAAQKQRRIAALEQEADQLRLRIEAQHASPRLTYIVQEGIEVRPILVELSARTIGIGWPQSRRPALWLKADRPDVRLEQFTSWARTRDRAREYFVILLKPSGFGQTYEDLVAAIRKEGFDVGTDLIPEDAAVLPQHALED